MPVSRHTDRYRSFQDALKGARKAAGLTQAQVGKRLGRQQSFVNKYETGERRLDVIEFLDVVDVLGASAIELLEAAKRTTTPCPKGRRRPQ